MKVRSRTATGIAAITLFWLAATGKNAGATVARATEGTLHRVTEKHTLADQIFPLAHTTVTAHITGFVAEVRVEQTFNNPFAEPLEAVYVFPLPDDAAVGAMTIRIGDRTIQAIIKSRAEARRLYREARRAGQTSARLDQERANIFTQSVANIPPGQAVKVEIVYDVALSYRDGEYEFVYPMVVGPRYIPGTPDGKPTDGGRAPNTDQVPDGSRITPPLRQPGSRSGHDVTMVVTLDPGLEILALRSPTHKITVDRDYAAGEAAVAVRIPPEDRIPNKDFVLRYRIAGEGPQLAALAEPAASGAGGYFTLLFEPPARAAIETVAAKELIFVIDSSASMSGEPMGLVKKAMRYALQHLNPDDTFQIIRSSEASTALGPAPLANTPANVRAGLSYVNAIAAGGGGDLRAGLRAALTARDPDRLRVVCFLTDGLTGNDQAILAELERLIDGNTRLFAFGIGSSVNRALLERMAEVGRGAAHYLLLDEPPADQVERLYQRIRSPIVTDIQIDWRGLAVAEVTPASLPDLFAGQPLTAVGRYLKPGAATIAVRGRLAGKPVTYRVAVAFPSAPLVSNDHASAAATSAESGEPSRHMRRRSLARLWARERIRALMASQYAGARADAVAAITDLGLAHDLVTAYTSLVAVDERRLTGGGTYRSYLVPVEMPEGVAYDAVFHDGDDAGDDGGDDDRAGPARLDEEARTAAPPPARDYAMESVSLAGAMAARPGSLRWGVSVGLGHGDFGEASGGLTAVALRLDRVVNRRIAVGGQLAVLVPLVDADDALFANLLCELAVLDLAHGLVDLTVGAGAALPSSGGLGLAYTAALELGLPWRIAPGFQLRFDGARFGDRGNLYGLTMGLKLDW